MKRKSPLGFVMPHSPLKEKTYHESESMAPRRDIRDASKILKDQPGYNPTTGKIHSAGTLGAADWLMGPKAITNIVSTTTALAPKIIPFAKQAWKHIAKKLFATSADKIK